VKDLDFPIFKTKSEQYKKFDLTDAKQRQEYFEYKAGPEIKKLREYLQNNSFIESRTGNQKAKGVFRKKHLYCLFNG